MAREITANTRAIPHVDEREVKIISLKRIVFLRFIRHRRRCGTPCNPARRISRATR